MKLGLLTFLLLGLFFSNGGLKVIAIGKLLILLINSASLCATSMSNRANTRAGLPEKGGRV